MIKQLRTFIGITLALMLIFTGTSGCAKPAPAPPPETPSSPPEVDKNRVGESQISNGVELITAPTPLLPNEYDLNDSAISVWLETSNENPKQKTFFIELTSTTKGLTEEVDPDLLRGTFTISVDENIYVDYSNEIGRASCRERV